MQFLSNKYQLSENQLFWTLQLTGWLALALLTYISLTSVYNQGQWLPYVLHPFVQSLIGIVVSWPMRRIFRAVWNASLTARLLVVTVSVLFFSLIWNFLRLVTFIWMTGEEMDFLRELSVWYFTGVLVFVGWAALYHGFRYYRLLQEEHESFLRIEREKQAERLKRENAERLAQESQLKMLRYQMNPHFLFNTMNAITSLVNSGRNREAAKMIDALSVFLRETLQGDPLRRVSLREEIQSMENYLGIEQVRFGDRLAIDIDVEGADPDFRVPGLILQPLAENVVKHAVRPSSRKVTLSVVARQAGERLDIEVSDDGPGIPEMEDGRSSGGGLGLQNVRDRLENIYGAEHGFGIEPREGGGLRVLISIPPERDAAPGEPAAVVERYG